ncbi:hypothetical protein GCM10023315_11500 [Algibacter aquimarinus]|uniref:Uncharacterized protein n=1 Tax=Algibacter aquimarinus TaxID=1136748 RepID=A0ABP9H8X8_9FLAO
MKFGILNSVIMLLKGDIQILRLALLTQTYDNEGVQVIKGLILKGSCAHES